MTNKYDKKSIGEDTDENGSGDNAYTDLSNMDIDYSSRDKGLDNFSYFGMLGDRDFKQLEVPVRGTVQPNFEELLADYDPLIPVFTQPKHHDVNPVNLDYRTTSLTSLMREVGEERPQEESGDYIKGMAVKAALESYQGNFAKAQEGLRLSAERFAMLFGVDEETIYQSLEERFRTEAGLNAEEKL
ncbi:hypothetical protein HOC80_00945 [archaeon]|jgi:hypothetical protein|nr:hypothetical protein [archaeon]MBT4416649.1 hypothetical protein [archaeon]